MFFLRASSIRRSPSAWISSAVVTASCILDRRVCSSFFELRSFDLCCRVSLRLGVRACHGTFRPSASISESIALAVSIYTAPNQEAAWEAEGYRDYVAALARGDMSHDVQVHAIAAFDLDHADLGALWQGLLDWQYFLSPVNALLAELPALPISWGSLSATAVTPP